MSQSKPVDIIIPTFCGTREVRDVTGKPILMQTIESLLACGEHHPIRIILVDNGQQEISSPVANVEVVNLRANKGWERGLIEGLKRSDSEFVVLANDDIFVPRPSRWWIRDFVALMKSEADVGGVGPVSNMVMGPQNIFLSSEVPKSTAFSVKFLIGFCVMYRRSALDKAGGIDDTLPGGDDLDLGIRVRKAGYRLMVKQDTYIHHHGFVTGEKVHGKSGDENGWNSEIMTKRTQAAIFAKHGDDAKDLYEWPGEASSTALKIVPSAEPESAAS